MQAQIKVICFHQQDQAPDLSLLSAPEQDRFHKMSAARGRVFALGRGALRCELAAVLGGAPAHVPLVQTDQGPTLGLDEGQKAPGFSVSHSGDYIAVALSTDAGMIGLDIEDISALGDEAQNSDIIMGRHDYRKIITRYFHPSEQKWIAAQPWPERAFYKLWTLKEAITKMERGAIAHYLKGVEIDAGHDPVTLTGLTPTGRDICHLYSYDVPPVMISVAADQPCQVEIKMLT